MRLWWPLLALVAAQGLVWAVQAPGGSEPVVSELQQRRAKLREELPDSLIVVFARSEKPEEDLRTGFAQDPDFYYLTGWREPGAILLLAALPKEAGDPGYQTRAALPREIFFVPRRNLAQEKWTGRKFGPEDPQPAGLTGCATVLPAEQFESEFRKFLDQYSLVYGPTRLKSLAPLRDLGDPSLTVARLRMKKSPHEIELIQRSTDATMAAHRAAWKRVRAGLYEYQMAATMMDAYFEQGCERSAYSPIVGSGPNSVVLHYSRNDRRMDAGELLLMDVGAECAGYASDITRTVPVNGRFTQRQREIYDVVLGAQKAVIAAVKPGMMLGKTAPNSLYKIAYDYINSHGKDLHGQPLGQYFIHGVSHHVGLEVHDASDLNMPLEEGMVITVEPGIYIPEENLGVRIEDMVLVTRDGAKVLSSALPREAEAVEKAVRGR